MAGDAADVACADVWTVRSPGQRAVIALGPLRRRILADVIFRDHWGADPGAPRAAGGRGNRGTA